MVKVLVVGQTPPPYHGQAIMIQRLLESKLDGVELIHVPMRFSATINEVGRFRFAKLAHLVEVIVRIIYHRFADRVRMLYYPPAGPDRVPMWRDIVILLTTRWLFDKTVFHFHAGGISELYDQLPGWQQWVFRRAFFGADAAVQLSELAADDGTRLQAKHVYLIPNGIDDPGRPSGSSTLAQEEIADEPLRILFVGALRESKGLLVLIEACAELARGGVPFQLEVMGQWKSDEFERQAIGRIEVLQLSDRVRFLGVLTGEDKFAVFRRAQAFGFPSFYNCEAFPLVLLEAMACGLPIVGTRWRGIPSIVDDCQTGFLVGSHDPKAVADRLATLARDPELRCRMGRAGRAKFEREYSHSRHISRMRGMLLETAGVACDGEPEIVFGHAALSSAKT